MGKEERYDVVIIGAGHNGTTTAAYLAKCGLSVCVLEERPECGGAQETVEPMAGVRIQPHAIGNYGGSAPGWEQLELWRYGFRMDHDPRYPVPFDQDRGPMARHGIVPVSDERQDGVGEDHRAATIRPLQETCCAPRSGRRRTRATSSSTRTRFPTCRCTATRIPELWTKEMLEWTMFDFMDQTIENEAVQGPPGVHRQRLGRVRSLPGRRRSRRSSVSPPSCRRRWPSRSRRAATCTATTTRCSAARSRTARSSERCCPVEEIIIQNGRAAGVRLRDDATWGAKTIWANKAVISAAHIKPTFLKMIGPRHLDAGFLQRIKDLSLKGGSLYMAHFLTREELRYRPQFKWRDENPHPFTGGFYCMENREIYYKNLRMRARPAAEPRHPAGRGDVGHWSRRKLYDPTQPQCTREGYYINGPLWMMVPTPRVQRRRHRRDGQERRRTRRSGTSTCARRCPASSRIWTTTTWCGCGATAPSSRNSATRACSAVHGTARAATVTSGGTSVRCAELSRYRVPDIDGLYLAHQSAAHPGGLCLMAVGYNLMHILIEDGVAEPGTWWYPSPWYIPRKRQDFGQAFRAS